MIKIDNLDVSYDTLKVLRDISLEFKKGSFVGILGPNGAGKTTFLRAIASLIPFEGNIEVLGRNLKDIQRKEIARLISMVPQDFQVDLEFKVIEIVLMGRYPYLRLFEFDGKEDYKIAVESLEITGSGHLKDRMFKNMSSGERRMVLLAKALAQKAELMLLDEPTSNLDPYHGIEIMRLLKKLVADGITVVASMHNINMASLYCDRIVLLKHGRIVGDGVPEEVITRRSIKDVYGVDVIVEKHPVTHKPHVFLVP
ncbi:hemin import ATP-binding protein HmuV [archaeon BMS3Bbin15]|nr:hemin import ATP-binding protein HmuV [archaeon BMS3Bbin15]